MALSTATITFDLADLLGVDFDARRTKVWVSTNIPDETVIDTAGNQIRLGSGKAVVNSDGTGSFTVWVPGTGSNPASWQTYVHVDYVDAGDHRKGRQTRTFGPFTITVNADLADLVQQAVVPPAILGGDAYMATVDADGSSQFRQQQDARLPVAIEAKLTADKGGSVFTPEGYGAVGDGVVDDTAAVRACFDAANARKRVVGNYYDPGATVRLRNTYKLSTLAAPIDVVCNVTTEGGMFVLPAGYAGVAVRVGGMEVGKVLQTADISLPKIVGATVAGLASLPVGSVGVQVRNLYTSRVAVGNITYVETALRIGGEGHGVAYNEFTLATMNWYKVGVLVKPIDAGGWANQNTFLTGALTGISTFTGGNRAAGVRAVVLDGVGSNTVTGNTFVGCAFESNVYEYAIELKNAYQNQFYGCRHEQGVAATATTVSGDTLTTTAHGLTVGNMVLFTATSTPTGMTLLWPYYVVATPTADTFRVSAKKGGTAITFTSAGTGVGFYRPPTIHYDKSWDNVIDQPMTPNTWLEQVFTSVTPADVKGNTIRYGHGQTVSAHAPATWPVHRARSTQAGAGAKMLWAAYPAATHPDEDPAGWTAALSDKGLHFGASGAETGWIGATSTGALTYQRPADASSGVTYDLPSCRRTGAGTTLTSGTVYAAGTRTTGTVALTGASVGDYVTWSTTTGLPPRGLTISAQVTSTGTITYAVDNNTGAGITLAADVILFFMAARRFL